MAMRSAIFLALVACAAAPSPREVGYAAELQACVADAGTREQSRECRAAVDARYGQPDGGAR